MQERAQLPFDHTTGCQLSVLFGWPHQGQPPSERIRNADRDAHLRAAELLDVQRRPTMSYRSTQVQGEGSRWTVDGELTIGDVTGPLTLAVEFGGVDNFFDGTRHAGFEATGEIRRNDFGLGLGALGAMLGDVVTIELDLEFVEPT